PGPATGLPTRTAQEDLLFAIRAGHGEFPRIVLAASDPHDAICKTKRAFDLADRYQTVAILLTDQFLADSLFSVDSPMLPDGPSSQIAPPLSIPTTYERYALTETGISPRLYFGQTEHPVILDSDEHDEAGHLTEDLRFMRPAMVEKRLEKGRQLKREMHPPQMNHCEDAEVALIGWGSTRGAIEEAVERLRATGRRVGSIHFGDLWPLPAFDFPENVRYWTVEGNATGQLASLLTAEYRVPIQGRIGRYDGLPLDAETIVKEWS
ncbi:2-oxoacid:acceptor oxidoreductase subunit alpha, partial [Candidatus Bipolaricaulota bacterium]|nr:2-oxoacid:acceptor oxidoreductase subunit alpha [Candidatus Bipolaricaulota bacterium]